MSLVLLFLLSRVKVLLELHCTDLGLQIKKILLHILDQFLAMLQLLHLFREAVIKNSLLQSFED